MKTLELIWLCAILLHTNSGNPADHHRLVAKGLQPQPSNLRRFFHMLGFNSGSSTPSNNNNNNEPARQMPVPYQQPYQQQFPGQGQMLTSPCGIFYTTTTPAPYVGPMCPIYPMPPPQQPGGGQPFYPGGGFPTKPIGSGILVGPGIQPAGGEGQPMPQPVLPPQPPEEVPQPGPEVPVQPLRPPFVPVPVPFQPGGGQPTGPVVFLGQPGPGGIGIGNGAGTGMGFGGPGGPAQPGLVLPGQPGAGGQGYGSGTGSGTGIGGPGGLGTPGMILPGEPGAGGQGFGSGTGSGTGIGGPGGLGTPGMIIPGQPGEGGQGFGSGTGTGTGVGGAGGAAQPGVYIPPVEPQLPPPVPQPPAVIIPQPPVPQPQIPIGNQVLPPIGQPQFPPGGYGPPIQPPFIGQPLPAQQYGPPPQPYIPPHGPISPAQPFNPTRPYIPYETPFVQSPFPFVPHGFHFVNPYQIPPSLPCPLSVQQGGQPCSTFDLIENLQLRIISSLIRQCGLAPLFQQTRNYTFFAPADQAFVKLPLWFMTMLQSDPKLCRAFILQHFIKVDLPLETVGNEFLILNARPGRNRVRFNVYYPDNEYRVYTVDGAKIVFGNIPTLEGRLNIMNRVIIPQPPRNAAQYLQEVPEFRHFNRAVAGSDLLPILQGSNPITLFVPYYKAFDTFDLDSIIANGTALRNFIHYHIVPGTWYSEGLVDGQYLTTFYQKEIKVSLTTDGFTKTLSFVNGNIRVLKANIPILNGVVHVIEQVMSSKEFFFYEHLSEFSFMEFGAMRRNLVVDNKIKEEDEHQGP